MEDHDRLVDLEVTDDRARAAYRRHRALTAGLGAVAVLAAIGAGGLLIQSIRNIGGPQRTDAATGPTPTPTTQYVPPPPPPPPPPSAVPGADLHVTGPTMVTLEPDGTVYRGQFQVTITNSGEPYTVTGVSLTLPNGVDVDFQAGDPGFSTCVTTAPPAKWTCGGPSVPAGGTVTHIVHLFANYAPLATPKTITGIVFRYGATGDQSPDDNVLNLTVTLAAAA